MARSERWIDTALRLPTLLIGFIVVEGYRVLIGWWLDPLIASSDNRRLEKDVRALLPFLFTERRGRVAPPRKGSFSPGFDYAFVTVRVGGLLIRFCRGRGEVDVRVASAEAPNDWHELSLLLSVLDNRSELERWGISDLRDAARTLETNLDRLGLVFAAGYSEELKQRLAEAYRTDKIAMRGAEWNINKRFR
jgi:hypothetical protein